MSILRSPTNKDVWIFPDYHTIATYYPGLTDKDGGLYGTECFYFDYYNAAQDALGEFRDSIDSGNYEIKAGKEIYNEYGGAIPISLFSFSDKWQKICRAQDRYLKAMHEFGFVDEKPSMDLLPPFYYEFAGGETYSKDMKNVIMPEYTMHQEHTYGTDDFKSIEEKYNSVHPLAHFPPMRHTKMFEEVIFFDPKDPDSSFKRIARFLAGSVATGTFSRLMGMNRVVTLADFIKPYEKHGFTIDFSIFGQPQWKYDIPFDDWLRDKKTLLLFEKAGLCWKDRAGGYNRTHISTDDWGITPKQAINIWRIRDDWIQYWLAGGMPPVDPNNIMNYNNGYAIGMKPCSGLGNVYPIVAARKPKSLLEAFFEIGFVLSSMVYSAATGNMGAILTTLTKQISPVIEKAIPEIASYVRFGTLTLTASILKSNHNDATATASTLMSMSGGIIAGDMSAEDAVSNINEGMTDREKGILSEIANMKEKRLVAVLKEIKYSPPEQVKNAFQKVAIARIKEESSSGLLIGSGIIGAALLYKYLKGR